MEEKYLLSTKTYEDWRNYLIVNSFFFDILLKKLRKDLDLPEVGITDLERMIKWDANKKAEIREQITPKSKRKKSGVKIVKEILGIEDNIRHKAYPTIWEAIEKFSDYNLNFPLIYTYVLGNTGMSFPGSSRVLMVSSPADPISETGVYIKYTPDLSENDMSGLMKQASDSFETLFKITHRSTRTHDKDGKPYIKRPELKVRLRKAEAPTPQQLKIYNAIEKYLKEKYINKPNSIKMQDVFKEVATEINVNKNSVQRSYHALLRNFHLPTSVDTKNIF